LRPPATPATLPRRRPRPPAVAPGPGPVLVACPDARAPAYEAAAGLAAAGLLGRFVTGFYYGGHGPASELARRYAPCQFARLRRRLMRRHDRRIDPGLVASSPGYDAALAIEGRLADIPGARRVLARWRTRAFDRRVAREVARSLTAAAIVFSDVGSEFALPACRRLGIPTILSMVHGDVREEREVLAIERAGSPDYYPLYLGDGRLDPVALGWLHARRLRDLALADRVLVPSDHIARRLVEHGMPRSKLGVVPYAADTSRFRPAGGRGGREGCTFLFAGGICQRKGIGYLLRAWSRVRRPGWRLQLVGAMPRRPGPLADDLAIGGVEVLGRVGRRELPGRMAGADVFVFPSLFEGSAVVTYEALAAGLPMVATAESGTVARDGIEGFLVPPRDVDALADRMERLGNDPAQRASMGSASRRRAEAFGWPRYHAAIVGEVGRLLVP